FRHCPASESPRRRSGRTTEAREFGERAEPAGVKELRRVHRDPYADGGRIPGRRRGSQVTAGGLCGAGRRAEAERHRGGPEPARCPTLRGVHGAAGQAAKAVSERLRNFAAPGSCPGGSGRAGETGDLGKSANSACEKKLRRMHWATE